MLTGQYRWTCVVTQPMWPPLSDLCSLNEHPEGCLSKPGGARKWNNIQIMICFKLLWKAQVDTSCKGPIEDGWRGTWRYSFVWQPHKATLKMLIPANVRENDCFLQVYESRPLRTLCLGSVNTQSYNKVNMRPSRISVQWRASASRSIWSPLPWGPVAWELVHLINSVGLFPLLGPWGFSAPSLFFNKVQHLLLPN